MVTALASGVGGRFTVGDVTAAPEMRQAAGEFIQGYRGDFEFLVRMKEVWSMQHTFTGGQTAAVLNCMRFEPEGLLHINNARQRGLARIAQKVEEEVMAMPQSMACELGSHNKYCGHLEWTEQRTLRLVTEPEPPAFFEVGVTWKRFWITADTMGRSHYLSLKKSRAIYFRGKHEIDFVMVALCGVTKRSMHSMARWDRDSSWALTQEPTKQVCRTCESKEDPE